MKRNKKFIELQEARRNRKILDSSYKKEKRLDNIILGSVLVGVGGITLPLPTGSIFLIMIGLFIYSFPLSLGKLVKNYYNDVKFYLGCYF